MSPSLTDVEATKEICRLLGRVPGWSWRPEGPTYTVGETAIFYGAIQPEPDRAIGVRLYAAADDLLHWRRVQIRIRGDRGRPDGADVLADLCFSALQDLSRVGGISGVSRLSVAPLGADSNGRQERADNYTVILDNPEAMQ